MKSHSPYADVVLPSEQRARDIEATQMFDGRTIWSVYAVAGTFGGGLWLRSQFHHTALLAPIDATFHAVMIGFGVFVGMLLAAVERDGWRLGIGRVKGGIPTGAFAILCMAVMIVISGVGGSYLAGQLVEWRAFHGIPVVLNDRAFEVVSLERTKSGNWLYLRADASGRTVSISSGFGSYPVRTGERLLLPVQVGRDHVERVTLPTFSLLHRT